MFTIKPYFRVPHPHGFERFQGWWHNLFPGQPIPMLDHPLNEEIFPNTQSKPSLEQVETISSCSVPCCWRRDQHLVATSFQVAKQSNEVPPYDLAFSLGNLPLLTPFSSWAQQCHGAPGLSQCRIRSRQALIGAYLLLWLHLFVKHNDGVGTHTSRTFLTKTTAQFWWRLLETWSCGSWGWQPHPTLGLAK